LCLIQGPPGTGISDCTAATLAYEMPHREVTFGNMFLKLGETEAAWKEVEVNSIDRFQGRKGLHCHFMCENEEFGIFEGCKKNHCSNNPSHGMVICGNA